ncbi:protein POLR1D-like [Phlebotomus argentipes]|uniref:protein POLR1D-like n=1 Tax=Phlebotomus argentipes TaxID=94469 RepID=UPI0028934AC5|nr:protein POLR1D-like [Phlebotomus argentipes]
MSDFRDHKMFQKKRKLTDEELRKLAIEELNLELVKASARAEIIGASGWKPCPLKKTNKRFLQSTLKSAVRHNDREREKSLRASSDKLSRLERRQKQTHREGSSREKTTRKSGKFGERKHEFRKPDKKEKESPEKIKGG